MASGFVPLAIVQFEQLPDEQKIQLAREVFLALEYDGNDEPGSEWDSDTTQNLGETFNGFGVMFTDPNDLPNSYRFNRHNLPSGHGCPWSEVSVVEPMKRKQRGNIHCPNGCPESVIDADHSVLLDDTNRIEFDDVIKALGILRVPVRMVEARPGEWLALLGDGEFDGAAERWTHPVQAGPIYQSGRQMVAYIGEFSYGTNAGTDEADGVEPDCIGAEQIATGMAEMLASLAPKALPSGA